MKQNIERPAGHSSNTLVSRSQFKPILFSRSIVDAIMEGRKTQTRRMVPEKIVDAYYNYDDWASSVSIPGSSRTWDKEYFMERCKWDVGDILWVRETFTIIDWWEDSKAVQVMYEDAKIAVKTLSDIEWNKFINWKDKSEKKPSLFLFKSLSRIFLKVTNISTERLHEIKGDDVLSEGVDNGKSNKAMGVRWENMQRMAFEDLWNKINRNWNENPHVFVLTFKVVECPQGFC